MPSIFLPQEKYCVRHVPTEEEHASVHECEVRKLRLQRLRTNKQPSSRHGASFVIDDYSIYDVALLVFPSVPSRPATRR